MGRFQALRIRLAEFSSSSGAWRSNHDTTISDGVHASIAPKQIACKVVMTFTRIANESDYRIWIFIPKADLNQAE
jgi:hypothetical protein